MRGGGGEGTPSMCGWGEGTPLHSHIGGGTGGKETSLPYSRIVRDSLNCPIHTGGGRTPLSYSYRVRDPPCPIHTGCVGGLRGDTL